MPTRPSYGETPLRPLLTMIMAGKDVRERLADITQPTLIITSRQDHVVNPEDSDVLAENIAGPVERVWLEKSFHVATLDYDQAEVEAAALAFAQKVTASSPAEREVPEHLAVVGLRARMREPHAIRDGVGPMLSCRARRSVTPRPPRCWTGPRPATRRRS